MGLLLNLLSAIALLVWGTHIVRSGVLQVWGTQLRTLLSGALSRRMPAALAGLGMTCLLQSSTVTCLIVASFAAQRLVSTGTALAVMLGADVGTALMATLLSADLAWLSPLLIVCGVVLFVSRENTRAGRVGRILIGLGVITLALQLITSTTAPLAHSPAVRNLIVSLPDDTLLQVVVGVALTILAYSSLAIVILAAALANAGVIPPAMAIGLVLGANLGSGILAVLATSGGPRPARRVPLGNLLFKALGCLAATPQVDTIQAHLSQWLHQPAHSVLGFHLLLNIAILVAGIGLVRRAGHIVDRVLPDAAAPPSGGRASHLDRSALSTPSLAITCAAREALHQADIVESMLRGIVPVIRDNDLVLAERLRKMDDTVDQLNTAIKLYLTQISRDELGERDSKRWADVVSFTINLEQVADIVESVLQDIEDRKIRKSRNFSEAGMAEIEHLHERLLANVRLGMSVFLDGRARDARKLLEEKARFRDLEHEYAARHLSRLRDNSAQSIETSSLHLDLISHLKRINSHICSIAYPILDAAGALNATRIRDSHVSEFGDLRIG